MSARKAPPLTSYHVTALHYSIVRLLFGLLMLPQVFSLVPHVHDLAQSTIVFHYPGLDFIEAYSHQLIDVLAAFAVAGATLLALGIIPRIGAFVFMCCFGYLFLIDMSFYNNHYYLWCLISFLYTVSDTHKSISVIDVFKNNTNKTIHIVNYAVLGLLISIVYFYGGVAKINPDWLQGYPMRLVTSGRGYPFPDALGLFLSYGGLVFDLAIPFLLWIKPKAWYIAIPYFAFHTSNYFMFNIGEFPLVMMAAWLLFPTLATYGAKNVFRDIWRHTESKVQLAVYTVFFAFQIIFPLRFLINVKNVAWHRQGHYFAWRMMLHNHEPEYFQYMVVMPDRNDKYFVDFQKLVTYRQLMNSFNDPYFIWKLAQKLHDDAVKKYHTANVQVYCNSRITLNQHPVRPLIKQDIDLSSQPYYFFSHNTFINY